MLGPVVDLLEFIYPESMYKPEGSPLHFAWKLHEFYISTYNDPIVQWSPQTAAQHDNWMGLFLHIEFLFLLPVVLWGLYRLGVQQKGTRGTDELLFFVYALEMAFTTLVCLHDTWYWDPTVYSDELKWTFRSQLYGPWFFIRECLSCSETHGMRMLMKVYSCARCTRYGIQTGWPSQCRRGGRRGQEGQLKIQDKTLDIVLPREGLETADSLIFILTILNFFHNSYQQNILMEIYILIHS